MPDAGLALELPEGSVAKDLLDRCLEASVARGTDVLGQYQPLLPVDVMQTLLVDVQAAAGCSWTMAIVAAVLGIRVLTLPLSIASLRAQREKALLQPRFQYLSEKQKALSMDGDQEKISRVAKEIQDFTQKHGRFFMLKGTGNMIFVQVPIYLTAFAAMRGFAGRPDLFPGFAMEAPLWLDSLAMPDPYGLLPLITASIMLTNMEVFGAIDAEVATPQPTEKVSSNVAGTDTFQKYQKWIMRGSSIFFVPMTWNFPAGVFIFMSTNFVSAFLQNRILRQPALERLLEIPPPPDRATAAAQAVPGKGPLMLIPLKNTLRIAANSTAQGRSLTQNAYQHFDAIAPAARVTANRRDVSESFALHQAEREPKAPPAQLRYPVRRVRPSLPGVGAVAS